MQSRIPRQSAPEQGGRHPGGRHPDGRDDDAGLSAELAEALSGARRRALRDDDRQIDTAHLLHSLLEADAEVRALFGDGTRPARLLGYLVQRSIGYGLRWRGSVEESGGVPVAPGAVTEAAGYSPLAARALGDARDGAARRGAAPARGVDLLAAIVAEPRARAVEVLARAGIDAGELLARIGSSAGECVPGGETSR